MISFISFEKKKFLHCYFQRRSLRGKFIWFAFSFSIPISIRRMCLLFIWLNYFLLSDALKIRDDFVSLTGNTSNQNILRWMTMTARLETRCPLWLVFNQRHINVFLCFCFNIVMAEYCSKQETEKKYNILWRQTNTVNVIYNGQKV